MHNWLITGIPRSGTTLLGALVDGMENSVCLNEPLWQVDLARASQNAETFSAAIVEDMQRLRPLLLAGQPVMDHRRPDGQPVTNYLNESGEVVVRPVPFSRAGLSADFTLAIKHNGLFLGALPALVSSGKFSIIALIRHPLEILASWRASSLPVARGELPAARYFWPEMAALHTQPLELLERQIRLLDLLYGRIREHEKRLTLIRYESLVKNPDQLSGVFGRQPESHRFDIKPTTRKKLDIPLELIEKKLKDIAPHARYYYPDF